MGNYAVIDSATGDVINVVVVDDINNWRVPDGCHIAEQVGRGFAIGGKIHNGKYTAPPEIASPPPAVENRVTARQARLALLEAGLLDKVEKSVASSDRKTQIAWEFANELGRKDSMVEAISNALGLSESEVDDLFARARDL